MFFFFKQKTAYEMRISDWSSDVCSSDLCAASSTGVAGADDGVADAATGATEVCAVSVVAQPGSSRARTSTTRCRDLTMAGSVLQDGLPVICFAPRARDRAAGAATGCRAAP